MEKWIHGCFYKYHESTAILVIGFILVDGDERMLLNNITSIILLLSWPEIEIDFCIIKILSEIKNFASKENSDKIFL